MSSRVLVQKFGGTSVATPERRRMVLDHVARARGEGYRVALVVSAMGRRGDPYATDTLLDLLRADGGAVDPADYNMVFVTGEMIAVAVVSQALRRHGIPSVPMSGVQARIHAAGHPLEAEVADIDTTRLCRHLDRDEVPVVTGGQAVFPDTLDLATLGRGASDTSGVALGVALGAERVEIFTDVIGVASTDPRLVPRARWVRRASYGRMHEFARFGAKVVHPRAILAGWKGRTPVVVRSTFSLDPGTYIGEVDDEGLVLGVATLAPMETALAGAVEIPEDVQRHWERQRLVMFLRDRDTGGLVLGAPADKSGELDRTLAEAGLPTDTRRAGTAWVSIIGEPAALEARRARDAQCLARAGVACLYGERVPGRTTFVVEAEGLGPAVSSLYDDLFPA